MHKTSASSYINYNRAPSIADSDDDSMRNDFTTPKSRRSSSIASVRISNSSTSYYIFPLNYI